MKSIVNWKNSIFIASTVALFTGCTGTTTVSTGYGVYGGYGYPSYGYGYYGGGGYYGRPGYRPPHRPGYRPDRPRPEQPIARPDRPTTKPSRPSMGRPSTRPMSRQSGMRRR